MGAAPVARLTVEEYLAMDRAAEVASEYHDGEVFSICGVTAEHSLINANLTVAVGTRLQNSPCRVYASPLRVRVSPKNFVYPDLMVICGKPVFTDESADTVINPKVIVEVLSPSTESYDYGLKFKLYRNLASLEEYIWVEPDTPTVEVFRKAGSEWRFATVTGMNSVLNVESLGLAIPLGEIYDRIEFPPGT